jgi:hypothetical protein
LFYSSLPVVRVWWVERATRPTTFTAHETTKGSERWTRKTRTDEPGLDGGFRADAHSPDLYVLDHRVPGGGHLECTTEQE